MTVQPRGGGGADRQLTLTRQKVKFNPVTSRLCGGTPRTGYLRVSTFSKQTAEGVGAALRALEVRAAAPHAGLQTRSSSSSQCIPWQDTESLWSEGHFISHALRLRKSKHGLSRWPYGRAAALHPEHWSDWLSQVQGADRYILDVRNNGGGSFPAGIQVLPLAGSDITLLVPWLLGRGGPPSGRSTLWLDAGHVMPCCTSTMTLCRGRTPIVTLTLTLTLVLTSTLI